MIDDMQELRQAVGLVYELLADPKLSQTIARMYRQLYHSLIEEGFSEDQALSILKAFTPQSNKTS